MIVVKLIITYFYLASSMTRMNKNETYLGYTLFITFTNYSKYYNILLINF